MARQVQRHHQQTGVAFVPVGDGGPTISFPGGVMHVSGQAQEAVRIAENASSNGLTKYVAVIWRDPATGELRTSCNCAGWAVKRGSFRTCKHVQALQDSPESGQSFADATAAATTAPSSVAPRTLEIVETIGRARRRIDI